jgi:hypothetical protein
MVETAVTRMPVEMAGDKSEGAAFEFSLLGRNYFYQEKRTNCIHRDTSAWPAAPRSREKKLR